MRYRLPQPYRDLEHTADVGVEVEGDTAGEALARLALAETSLLTGGVPASVERDEPLSSPPGERVAMAIAILRDLLFRFATERLLAVECEVVSFDPAAGAELIIGVGRFDPERHREGLDLKAVTWHQARLDELGGRWRGRIVFDI